MEERNFFIEVQIDFIRLNLSWSQEKNSVTEALENGLHKVHINF